MIITNTIKMAVNNLRVNKMRSFLTMLGIIIGISSVIIVMSVGAGAQSLIINQIRSVGSNLIGILPGASEEEGPPAAVFGVVITSLKDADIKAIKDQVPHVEAAASYVTANETATWQNKKTDASINGTTEDYPLLDNSQTTEGEFFTADDVKGITNVAVIGSKIKEDLFENRPALGEKIKIKKINFQIIGVMEPRGVIGFQNVDNIIFIPVTTAQKKLVGINHIGYARVKVDSEENIENVREQIELLLRDRHNIDTPTEDDFTVQSTQSAISSLTTVTDALTLFLVAIAAIALIVGGIGIMNIMLASVMERIKEIGLRKAVGAKKSHIIFQFLVETIVISLLSAIIGIIIGALFSLLVAKIMQYLDYDWDYVVSLSSILLACGVAILIGLIFGLFPARKAAKFEPIAALRYE